MFKWLKWFEKGPVKYKLEYRYALMDIHKEGEYLGTESRGYWYLSRVDGYRKDLLCGPYGGDLDKVLEYLTSSAGIEIDCILVEEEPLD